VFTVQKCYRRCVQPNDLKHVFAYTCMIETELRGNFFFLETKFVYQIFYSSSN
jgi:hypothetical protein